MSKKKYFIFLLVLLFGILLGIFSTCFASVSDDFSDNEVNQINEKFGTSFYKEKINECYNNLKNTYPNLTKRNIFFVLYSYYSERDLFIFPNNGTFGTDDLSYAYIKGVGMFATDSIDGVTIRNIPYYSIYYLTSNVNSQTVNSFLTSKDAGTTVLNSPTITINGNILTCDYILTTVNTQSFYYASNIWGNNTNSYFSSNYIILDKDIIPDEPSGDISTTGTITNNSGETTGRIDLTNIENGINDINNNLQDISNKIPTSGDIANSVAQANENYWGGSGDLNGDAQMEQIGDNLNSIMAELSGDLGDNEVFNSIQEAENGFLDLFRNRQEESAYDLKFEWNDFEYNGVVLIPKGSINISQLCRDNVQLGYIQGLIRIVFNFEVALTLIYQIWNLILATLGIDNPFLYEDYDGVERINGDTGEVHTTIVRRKRFYRKGGK